MDAKQKVQKALTTIKAYLPEGPPQSDAAMRAFALGVCQAGGFPENDSFLNAVATQFLHLDADVYRVRKIVFVRALKRSVANQAAFGIMQEIKQQEKAAKDNAEATQNQNTTGA